MFLRVLAVMDALPFAIWVLTPGFLLGVMTTLLVQLCLASLHGFCKKKTDDMVPMAKSEGKKNTRGTREDTTTEPGIPGLIVYVSQSGICHKRHDCSGMRTCSEAHLCKKCW